MEGDPKTYEPNPPGGFFFIGWVAVVVVILGLTAGLVLARGLRLNRQTAALEQKLQAGPRVLVQPVSYSPRTRTIAVPGSIHGYVEVPVYAKIAGYLERLQVDKGDHVKAGQLIGVIDS